MRKTIKKILMLISSSALFVPQLALSDGMIAPPPDYYMYESDQQAVVFYEQGVETLVISIKFSGDAQDFAWIVPTPSQPEVTKGALDLFSNLNELTQPPTPLPMERDLKFFDTGAEEGVTILEEKQVEYYDLTVLAADDKNALFDWLNNNGYSYPSDKKYILSSYVDNGWYFTAMKINTEAISADVSQALRTGQAVPVKLTFKADKIVYPLKISSVMAKNDDNLITKNSEASLAVSFTDPSKTMPLNLNSSDFDPSGMPASLPSYTEGKFNKGVIISKNSALSYPAQNAFFEKEGTIEMWVNPKWWGASTGYWTLVDVINEKGQSIFEFRRAYNRQTKRDSLQLIFHRPPGASTLWETESGAQVFEDNNWYHLAVTWQVASEPKLYVNGQALSFSSKDQGKNEGIKSTLEGKIYLGQRRSSSSSFSVGAILDEVRISNRARTAEEIAASYNQSSALSTDSNTLFLAHFDDNLTVSDKDSDSAGSLTYSRNRSRFPPVTYPTRVTVTLYTIADHKKELNNFTTQYANWIKDKKIKELALDDQGNPWISPSGKKYYLTRLYASLNPATQMTQDLYPQDADNNDLVNAQEETEIENQRMIFLILMIIGSALTLGILFFLIWQYQLKK